MIGSIGKVTHRWMVLLSILSAVGCSEQVAQPQASKPSVIVNSVTTEEIQTQSEIVGRTHASEDVIIQARISGQLLKRHFVEGNDVKTGELLFEIDPSTYEAELAQQQAVLKQAIASRDVAIMNWERGKRLLPEGMISAQDMDELTSRKLTTSAGVIQSEAAVKAAELQLSYTKIYAPISGRISDSFVSQGDIISTNSKMASLVQLQPMWVNFQVAEKTLINAQESLAKSKDSSAKIEDIMIDLRLPNGSMFSESGYIDFISNRVDATTGTLAIRATFKNELSQLLPGMFVTLIIKSPTKESALLIPQAAVQEDQQGRFVMVVNEQNQVEKRVVELGERFGINWRVLSGLSDGDIIVVDGLQKIRPGIEVNTQEQQQIPFSEPNDTVVDAADAQ